MVFKNLLVASAVAVSIAAPAFAQPAKPATIAPVAPKAPLPVAVDPNAFEHNAVQQALIKQGIASGKLSAGEAGRLEKAESNVDAMESHAAATGFTKQEQYNIQKAQEAASKAITAYDTNSIKGNPASTASKDMEADVQRNLNQQLRIQQGAKTGSLTNAELSRVELGQKNIDVTEAYATKRGTLSASEQKTIQARDNGQSRNIYRYKHNSLKTAPEASTTTK